MKSVKASESETDFAVRVGAASIYLFIGLLLGLCIAVGSMFFSNIRHTPSFASIVFCTGAISAIIAAMLPNLALASISSIAHFTWGALTGVAFPEAFINPEPTASKIEKLVFWLGLAGGIGLLLLILFGR